MKAIQAAAGMSIVLVALTACTNTEEQASESQDSQSASTQSNYIQSGQSAFRQVDSHLGDSFETPYGPVTFVSIERIVSPFASGPDGPLESIPGLTFNFEYKNESKKPQVPYFPDGIFYFSGEDKGGQDITKWSWSSPAFSPVKAGETTTLNHSIFDIKEDTGKVYLAIRDGNIAQTIGAFTYTDKDIPEERSAHGVVETPKGLVYGQGIYPSKDGFVFRYSILNTTDKEIEGYCNGAHILLNLEELDGQTPMESTASEDTCPVAPRDFSGEYELRLPELSKPTSIYVYTHTDTGALQRQGTFLVEPSDTEENPQS